MTGSWLWKSMRNRYLLAFMSSVALLHFFNIFYSLFHNITVMCLIEIWYSILFEHFFFFILVHQVNIKLKWMLSQFSKQFLRKYYTGLFVLNNIKPKTRLKTKERRKRHPQYEELHGNCWQKIIGLIFFTQLSSIQYSICTLQTILAKRLAISLTMGLNIIPCSGKSGTLKQTS